MRIGWMLWVGCCALIVPSISHAATPPKPLPTPTHADAAYGNHERHVLDFWQAKSDRPAPLLVFIHGGGWRGGDKNTLPIATLQYMLDHGVSVASINYRYSTIAPLPAPVHDAARAIQFLRSKAGEWNLNADKVAAMGISAGACTSLWLAYHDDLAASGSSDPVARQSTRLCAAYAGSGQTSIDPKVVESWVGPEILRHGMIHCAVGAQNIAEVNAKYEQYAPLYREFSPINHVDGSDPPVLMIYPRIDPLPAANSGSGIHHAKLGRMLKEKAEASGARATLQITDQAGKNALDPHAFLLEQLTR